MKKNVLQGVISVICLFIILFIGYLIIKEFLYIDRLKADIESVEQEYQHSMLLLNQMQEVEKASAKMESQNAVVQKLIPKKPMQDQILRELQGKAETAAVFLENVTFEDLVGKDDFMEMPLSLSFRGNYNGLLKLLSSLMYGERLVRIDRIRIVNHVDSLIYDINANYFFEK